MFVRIYMVTDLDLKLLRRKIHSANDVCVLPFSSGTTGFPKGVMLTHNNIASNCEMVDSPMPYERLTMPTTNDYQEVFPCVLPFFHIYGFTISLISKLALGCKLVTLPRFEPQSFLSALLDHKATFIHLVPPLVLFLADDIRATSRHLDYVRGIICGAAPIGALDALRFRKK